MCEVGETDTESPEELGYKIQMYPCLEDKPYAFISYRRADREYVWRDVCELQKYDYNIWIDINEIHAEDPPWNEKARSRIEDKNCKLFVFYISENSVISGNCLEELRIWENAKAKRKADGEDFPMIRIEVKPVEKVWKLCSRICREIEADTKLGDDTKQIRIETMTELMGRYCPNENEYRIASRDVPGERRTCGYIEEIEECFNRNGLRPPMPSPQEEKDKKHRNNFRASMESLDKDETEEAEKYLRECADEGYLAATVLLYFLFGIGTPKWPNRGKMEKLEKASAMKIQAMLQCDRFYNQSDPVKWKEEAKAETEKEHFLEAAAFYAAYSYDCSDSDDTASDSAWEKAKDMLNKAKEADASIEGENLYYSFGEMLKIRPKKKNEETINSQLKESRERIQEICSYGGIYILDSSALRAPGFLKFVESHFDVLKEEKNCFFVPDFAEAELEAEPDETKKNAVRMVLDSDALFERLREVKNYYDLILYMEEKNKLNGKMNLIAKAFPPELTKAKNTFLEEHGEQKKIFIYRYQIEKNGILKRSNITRKK